MSNEVLVFGATGQQGGSVAAALLQAGWRVRALVRNPGSKQALALRDAGVTVVKGDFADADAMRLAMQGVYGVFSVQPSSGQGAELGLSDEDEERFGIAIADMAVHSGVKHLIYSSTAAVSSGPTGMGHFDSKLRIENHVRTLPITATVVRPAAFMEMLLMPGFGLDQGEFNFFMRSDQPMQFIAVQDIGAIVAAVLADPLRFGGTTFEIASAAATGDDLQALFSQAAGRPITYSRFSDQVLAGNDFLRRLAELLDAGALAGRADLGALRQIHPGLQTFESWIKGPARYSFEKALGTPGAWAYGTADKN
ncbi:NmrA/HSCARG family protein [Paucibacter sp. M5-1]|uniref:NmrA/HSCARG family protein n=1 Tax=Paucibacter sp. M5-1 TaxID=3015998 RepID=UPI0022B8B6B5|nr:NmrA/HSCARG family protein [Paucibacter sp. M5-1]MCZ7880465.1 NmrA/HSCARG family protein [Paucibacter sp. M5-1]